MLTATTGCAVAQRAVHEHDLTQRIVGAFFAKPSWRQAFAGRRQAQGASSRVVYESELIAVTGVS
jgi:hypothetical protein